MPGAQPEPLFVSHLRSQLAVRPYLQSSDLPEIIGRVRGLHMLRCRSASLVAEYWTLAEGVAAVEFEASDLLVVHGLLYYQRIFAVLVTEGFGFSWSICPLALTVP